MRILWVNCTFLHPTTKGGQIRTLEMLRRISSRHEVHYVGLVDPSSRQEALAGTGEYCVKAYPIEHIAPPHSSLRFLIQAGLNLFSGLPLAVSRYRSREMRRLVSELRLSHRFDAVVSDFLFASANLDQLQDCVLFEHNVETAIWQRREVSARNALARWYLGAQARRMYAYEEQVCRAVRHVIAVSPVDADSFRQMFGVQAVSDIPTGVDVDRFAPPPGTETRTDLVFVGSMDWMPNIDAVKFFVAEVLPLIRRVRPACSLTIVGRTPPPDIAALASNPLIRVTGTVPDVRPYLWESAISIVPMRVGSGTRLKIFEAMAARVPVVSTTVGAEGLPVTHPHEIRIADSPQDFARECLALLDQESLRRQTADAAWELVSSHFSWEQVTRQFEEILLEAGQEPTT